MRFREWLDAIVEAIDDEAGADDYYFTIGHGDGPDESGAGDNDYVVWAWLDGRVRTGPPNEGTHGSLWGHERCDSTWKGRYEPNSGRVSVVAPCRLYRLGVAPQPPQWLLDALAAELGFISKIISF